jgi:hypothetical protein
MGCSGKRIKDVLVSIVTAPATLAAGNVTVGNGFGAEEGGDGGLTLKVFTVRTSTLS